MMTRLPHPATPPVPQLAQLLLRCRQGAPAYLAVLYLVVGLTWIFGTDYIVTAAFGETQITGLVGIAKGVLFVVVTAALFYLALRSRQAAIQAAFATHYEYAINYTSDIFILAEASPPFRILEINDRALNVYGYTREELVGMPVSKLRVEALRSDIERDIERYVAEQPGTLYEALHRRKDGSIFPVEISGRVGEHGGQSYIQLILRDISERKRHETILANSRRHLLTLLDSLPDPTWMKDADGRYIAANHALADFLHVDVPDLIGKKSGEFFASARADAFSTNERRVVDSGKPSTTEDCFDTETGRRWYDTIVLPIAMGEEGDRTGTVGIAHDITDRKLMEQEHRHHAEHMERLLENVPDPILRFDRESRCIYANHVALEVAGRAGTDIRGKLVRETGLPEESAARVEGNVAAVFESGQQRRFEMETSLPDENNVLDVLLQPEFDSNRQVATVLGIGRDLTVYRHLAEEHQRHERQLRDMLVETIRAMALTVEKRDPYTAGHQERAAQLAVAIGREIGLSAQQIEGLRLGGMIHDIGKIYIPAEILNRPGRLTKEEMALIRTHAEVGYDIVKDIHFVWPVKEIILQHHERLDGSGYPLGLKGDEISREARIIAVADVVEAISSHRPYRAALGLQHGLDVIRDGSGTVYDVDAAEACLTLFAENRFSFSGQP